MEVLQVPSELEQMRALYRERKPRRVLEIGVWDGGTLREWLAEQPNLVVAIDLDHRNYEAYDEWQHRPTELVLGYGRSQDKAILSLMRENAPYDWVFIDGDHDEGPVGQDADNAVPLIRPGGLLLFHDIVHGYTETATTGPRKAFDRLAKDYVTWEIVGDPRPSGYPGSSAHGIGVVQL